jgi:MerR family redox-sensitive transcriptional activator SoxR
VATALRGLPGGRNPTQADWTRLSRGWRPLLDARIAELTRLRDQLDTCIGCGCLSLKRCALYNPADGAAALGPGPRYLMGDAASKVMAAAAAPK